MLESNIGRIFKAILEENPEKAKEKKDIVPVVLPRVSKSTKNCAIPIMFIYSKQWTSVHPIKIIKNSNMKSSLSYLKKIVKLPGV